MAAARPGLQARAHAKHGVAEYWLVDPSAETVWIRRPDGRALVVAQTLRRGQKLRLPLLPGFVLDLEDVFSSLKLPGGAPAHRHSCSISALRAARTPALHPRPGGFHQSPRPSSSVQSPSVVSRRAARRACEAIDRMRRSLS